MAISSVTERVCRVQLLATQKSINRLGWWKGKFALFQMPATGGGMGWGGQMSVQRLMAPKKPVGNQWGKSFYRQSCTYSKTQQDQIMNTVVNVLP